jgi:hypothetical protein
MIRASSLHRYRHCTGSPKAEAAVRQDMADKGIRDPAEAAWTGNGRIVHDALKDDSKMKDLEDDLFDVATHLAESAAYVVDKIFPESDGIERGIVVRERDEPFCVTHNGKPVISGHPDFIQYGTIYGKLVALILDFKSGFLEVPAPECNDQLRAYAVAVWQESQSTDEPLDEVYASIIPRFGRATPVHYTDADLPNALFDLIDVHEGITKSQETIDAAVKNALANGENAEEAAQKAYNALIRIPSVDACRYCQARATSRCPETLYTPETLKTMPSLIDLTPEEKGELLALSKIVQGNIKKLTDRLYEELESDPEAVTGWELAPGKIAKNIENVAACYSQVQDLLEPDEFQNCLKVQKTKLTTALKGELAVLENIKGMNAQKRIDDLLSPVIMSKQGKWVLAQIGAPVELEAE